MVKMREFRGRIEENMLLIEKVKNLSDDKLTKILNYVKDVINE